MPVHLALPLLAFAALGRARAEEPPPPAEPVYSAVDAASRYSALRLAVAPRGVLRVIDASGATVDPWTLALLADDEALQSALRRHERESAWHRTAFFAGSALLAGAAFLPIVWAERDRDLDEVSEGYDTPNVRRDVNLTAGVTLIGASAGLVVYGVFGPVGRAPTLGDLCTPAQARRDVDAANITLRRQLGLEALATPAPASTDPPTEPGG